MINNETKTIPGQLPLKYKMLKNTIIKRIYDKQEVKIPVCVSQKCFTKTQNSTTRNWYIAMLLYPLAMRLQTL